METENIAIGTLEELKKALGSKLTFDDFKSGAQLLNTYESANGGSDEFYKLKNGYTKVWMQKAMEEMLGGMSQPDPDSNQILNELSARSHIADMEYLVNGDSTVEEVEDNGSIYYDKIKVSFDDGSSAFERMVTECIDRYEQEKN